MSVTDTNKFYSKEEKNEMNYLSRKLLTDLLKNGIKINFIPIPEIKKRLKSFQINRYNLFSNKEKEIIIITIFYSYSYGWLWNRKTKEENLTFLLVSEDKYFFLNRSSKFKKDMSPYSNLVELFKAKRLKEFIIEIYRKKFQKSSHFNISQSLMQTDQVLTSMPIVRYYIYLVKDFDFDLCDYCELFQDAEKIRREIEEFFKNNPTCEDLIKLMKEVKI